MRTIQIIYFSKLSCKDEILLLDGIYSILFFCYECYVYENHDTLKFIFYLLKISNPILSQLKYLLS